MKKIFLLLTFVMGWITLKAQTNVYHPFPEENAMWNEYFQICCMSRCGYDPDYNPEVFEYNNSIKISGDTVIGSYIYYKLQRTGTISQHCSHGNYPWNVMFVDNYVGAYRQDISEKKVYFVSEYRPEYVLYDFNLNVGDTVKNWENCHLVISSIDSILIDNNYRKRFNLAPSSPYSIIEGIGSTVGLFERLCPSEEYSGNLICFSQNGQTVYPNGEADCEQITAIGSLKAKSNKIEAYPNPFSVNTTLRLPYFINDGVLRVENCFGQILKQLDHISGESLTLNRDNFTCGVYFIYLFEKNQIIAKQKLIVLDN